MPRQLPQGHATRAVVAVRRVKACGRGEELAGPGDEEDRLTGCSECWDEDVLHHGINSSQGFGGFDTES